MSEEIKVGEYFRNNSIGIMQFVYGMTYMTKDNKEEYIYYLKYENGKTMPLNKKGLKDMKHSPNIIDLIEEGDYVNGMELFEFDDDETGELYLGFPIYDDGQMDCIEEVRPLNTIEIKSIVTKEQFERMEYKVNE